MNWKKAVNDLTVLVAKWAPSDLERHRHKSTSNPEVRTLELSRNGRRLYLEPAEWAAEQLPTSVDLWSSRGPRVRLVGPDTSGAWKVLTSDLIDMHLAWEQDSFARVCEDLLAV